MTNVIIVSALILIICIGAGKLSEKLGLPTLLFFLLIGIIFGGDGLFRIEFANFEIAEKVCSIALIFIMFYGGFGTNWKVAKPVAGKALLLSSFGTVITAGVLSALCHLILKIPLDKSFLIGAVVSSTDAASVFSILRSKNLNLKDGMASLLEIESGSNDPFSYMLTIVALSFVSKSGGDSIFIMVTKQIGFGVLIGLGIALFAYFFFKYIDLEVPELHTLFILAIALLSYAVPLLIGGNGYLSAYLVGIILGNVKFRYKIELVHFFDSLTWIMQMVLFFLLGLLSFPSQMKHIFLPAVGVFLILTLIARPIAVHLILLPFKVPLKNQLLIVSCGMRGAASIVFATYAITSGIYKDHDIFNIVFLVCLLSVAFQGTAVPIVARKLKLVDNHENVLKTFNDFQDDSNIHLIEMLVVEKHPWVGIKIAEIRLPKKSLIVMIKRNDLTVIPRGNTIIEENDMIVMSCPPYEDKDIELIEIPMKKRHKWIGSSIREIKLPPDTLVVMIKREEKILIPKGDTKIERFDTVVINNNIGAQFIE